MGDVRKPGRSHYLQIRHHWFCSAPVRVSANNANAIGSFGREGLFGRAGRTRGWLWRQWRRIHDDDVRFWLGHFFVEEEERDANNGVVRWMTKMVRMGNFLS